MTRRVHVDHFLQRTVLAAEVGKHEDLAVGSGRQPPRLFWQSGDHTAAGSPRIDDQHLGRPRVRQAERNVGVGLPKFGIVFLRLRVPHQWSLPCPNSRHYRVQGSSPRGTGCRVCYCTKRLNIRRRDCCDRWCRLVAAYPGWQRVADSHSRRRRRRRRQGRRRRLRLGISQGGQTQDESRQDQPPIRLWSGTHTPGMIFDLTNSFRDQAEIISRCSHVPEVIASVIQTGPLISAASAGSIYPRCSNQMKNAAI